MPILLLLVQLQSLDTLVRGPGKMLGPFSFVFHHRNAVAAGMGDPCDVDHDDRARRLIRWKFRRQIREFSRTGLHNTTHAMQTKNVRTSLKLTEHDHDPAILFQVRNRLDTAADYVEIGDGPRTENTK